MKFKNKSIIFLSVFSILSIIYFWYSFKVFIPKKSIDIANYFISNESSRHILKVSILNEKGFRFYIQAIKEKDEELLDEAIDLTSSAEGFLTSFSFDGVKSVPEISNLISTNVQLMEDNTFKIGENDLAILINNVEKISKIVQVVEMYKYDNLLEGIISREENTYTIIISIIYLSISIVFLIIFLLYVLYRNKKLEEENLKQQKFLLTQSKIAALGDILINIAHQWRQPLSAITTSVSGLKLYLDLENKVSDESIKKCYLDVMQQAEFLSKTIDDFNEFIKEDSTISKKHHLFNIFSKLKNLVNEMFIDNSIKIIIKVDKELEVNLNDNILIQSFINICYNAKDAYIHNNIKYENRYFFINAYKNNKDLHIHFKDSAGGVSSKIIDKIFEPYFTTKHEARGTGIGLYRTNQIITQHFGGTIECSNISYTHNEKKLIGAEFILIIPLNKINKKI